SFTSDDPLATLPGPFTFTTADHGLHAFTATFRTAGLRTLTASEGPGGASGSATIDVRPGIATGLALSLPPASPYAQGTPFMLIVSAVDAFGNVDPTYTGTVTISSNDPRAALPGTVSFTTADMGTRTFTVALHVPGLHTITATDAARGFRTVQNPVNVFDVAPVLDVHRDVFLNLTGLLDTTVT